MSRLPPDPPGSSGHPGHVEETRMESADEIRQILRGLQPGAGPPAHAPSRGAPPEPSPFQTAAAPALGVAETRPYRPARRPPMALLCVLDDGRDDGEWFRLRADQTVIGRSEGDIRIPHDSMMSGRHAEIVRQLVKGAYTWTLNDLGSTNGTFVRVSGSVLKHGHEMLIGSRRFRFESGQPGQPTTAPAAGPHATSAWQAVAAAEQVPTLVEVTAQGRGQMIPLTEGENWIGGDARACTVVLGNDPSVSPRHARIYRDSKNRWRVENAGSLNGTWLRVARQPLEGAGQFQLGEQRFLLRTLS
jgi:pSer/pThr/pTyr-binding forkhead associated (FHA) protein